MAHEKNVGDTSEVQLGSDGEVSVHAGQAILSFTPEEDKAVLRKIDFFILPFMCVVFFLQYADKQSYSYAGVFNMVTDLKLTSHEYSWGSSIFYVGQLVSEYPCIYLMSRLPLGKFVGGTIILWGIVCMCLAAPRNFADLAAIRFLLGFTEGAVSPAFVTITSIWYRKHEHSSRTAIWVTMNGLAQIVGCLLMYGLGKRPHMAIAPWRVLFLVFGGLTVVAGIAFFLFMPVGPNDAWFLTPREKEVLSARMAQDRDGGDKTSFSTAQLLETLKDPKAWLVFWFGVLVTMQAPVLTFASFIIKSTGHNNFQTMLLTAPSGAVQIAYLWIGVGLCYIFPRNRTYVVMALCLMPLGASVGLMKLPSSNSWGVIVTSWLASCITAIMSPLLALSASNVKGNTKRAIVNTMFFIGYCAGCIASPQLWTHKPRYTSGIITCVVTWSCMIVAVAIYRWLCSRDNAARGSKITTDTRTDELVLDDHGNPKSDLTDKQDPRFRYST